MVRGCTHRYTAPMKIFSVVWTLALFGICGSAMAQWQWLDTDGRKVFSDRAPPMDVPEKSILKRPNAAAKALAPVLATEENQAMTGVPVASRPVGTGIDKELEAKKKQATEAEAAKRKSEEEKALKSRIENCARAKQAKASIGSGIRIAQTNAAGEREVMDDAGRGDELRRIQTIIDSECR